MYVLSTVLLQSVEQNFSMWVLVVELCWLFFCMGGRGNGSGFRLLENDDVGDDDDNILNYFSIAAGLKLVALLAYHYFYRTNASHFYFYVRSPSMFLHLYNMWIGQAVNISRNISFKFTSLRYELPDYPECRWIRNLQRDIFSKYRT